MLLGQSTVMIYRIPPFFFCHSARPACLYLCDPLLWAKTTVSRRQLETCLEYFLRKQLLTDDLKLIYHPFRYFFMCFALFWFEKFFLLLPVWLNQVPLKFITEKNKRMQLSITMVNHPNSRAFRDELVSVSASHFCTAQVLLSFLFFLRRSRKKCVREYYH